MTSLDPEGRRTVGQELQRAKMRYIVQPFQEFARAESAGGILLLVMTAVALIWANSPWADAYFELWQKSFAVSLAGYSLQKPVLLWINDGLMTIFFFLVGLEIKREILVGELSEPRQAILPLVGAAGGMLVPAALYLAVNRAGAGEAGWGVPMATDIAFALGILSLLGERVPVGLKVLLTAVAIVDDIGAVLVIAFFYSAGVSWLSLGGALITLGILLLFNLADVRRPLPYLLFGIILWFFVLKSGIHPTIAGVALAMMVPARAQTNSREFLTRGRSLLEEFEQAGELQQGDFTPQEHLSLAQGLHSACQKVETPLQRFEHTLLPWVNFLIMPLFAFSNAGVSIGDGLGRVLSSPVAWGTFIGLLLGKQLGVMIMCATAVLLMGARLPDKVTWAQLYGACWLAGVGFTMALFIAGLAFDRSPLLDQAKLGVLGASLISGLTGFLILYKATASRQDGAETV